MTKQLFLATFLVGLIFTVPAQAQSITPSHVAQAADDAIEELKLLLDANFSDTSVPSASVIPGKKPRHVIQKGQEILRQIVILKQINGQKMDPVQPVPVREIRPADVKQPVDRIVAELRSLKSVFRVTAKAKPATLQKGLKPGDVYSRLEQVGALLNRLDMPKPVPNDVHRSALAILADVKIISKAIGMEDPGIKMPTFKGKSPGNVYTHARETLLVLKSLVETNDKLKIPGGIVLPPQKIGAITPGDVLDMQNTILAEISSIKVKAGANASTPEIAPPSGKTPSDVFGATDLALTYVREISLSAAGG